MTTTTKGRLYGLGLGPGDPELLTVKALRLLRAAPVVAFPRAAGGTSFARSIVAAFLSPHQFEIAIDVPMAPDPDLAVPAYDQAATEISAQLDRGRDVAVLCQGDPFFYGSFMYLFERLGPDYPVEIVPGVTSLTSSAAMLAMPLASLDEVVTVLPASLPSEVIAEHLARTDCAAIVKLGRHFARIREVLAGCGLIAAARYIERATLPAQRILPIDVIDPTSVPYFSMILVRKAPGTTART
ncbi:MAG TPA: precorrin-2 C(20)-methyltransferase [Stellaceae bacterium]|nr:precorrin-2 C(20)-methyltransferase [Stellaceae bacterium]